MNGQPGKKIRALIVDDEPIVRWGLRTQLAIEPDVEVIGECANGLEAVSAIREERPDLVFLDIQMPVLDGFGVLEAIGADAMPAVVFVTAHDQYALRAFEVHALDYLLKPFDHHRFRTALERARASVARQGIENLGRHLRAVIKERRAGAEYLERLVVKSSGCIFFLVVREVDWIEAADNYVELHVGRESYLVRETLRHLETRLDPKDFLRIRHSTIVNVHSIRELNRLANGEYVICLHGGAELTSSRRYRRRLRAIL